MDPRNVFYEYARPILEQAVHRAAMRYGYATADELEDLRRDADLIYAEAQATHWPGSGLFVNHLKYVLARRLGDAARDRARRARILNRVDADVERVRSPDEGHWTDDLSPDADKVVRLVASTRPGLDYRQAWRRVKDYLKEVGWTAGQIAKCWHEIAEALRDP